MANRILRIFWFAHNVAVHCDTTSRTPGPGGCWCVTHQMECLGTLLYGEVVIKAQHLVPANTTITTFVYNLNPHHRIRVLVRSLACGTQQHLLACTRGVAVPLEPLSDEHQMPWLKEI